MPDEKKHVNWRELGIRIAIGILGVIATLGIAGANGWMALGGYRQQIQTNTAAIDNIEHKEIPSITDEIGQLKAVDAGMSSMIKEYKEGTNNRLDKIEDLLTANNYLIKRFLTTHDLPSTQEKHK
jgi:hypothetical protein